MTQKKKLLPGAIAASLIIFGFSQINAGPTIIRDNRITDIGITPVPGRGYSISTNTMQSTCLSDVKLTTPSYDFTYTFKTMEKSLDTTNTSTSDRPVTSDVTINNRFLSYLRTQIIENRRGTTSTKTNQQTFRQRMVANIDLDSYYSSVDEANSKISESASKLLTNKDLPGFFASCGPYYIRSLNRRAKLISIFEYETETDARDKSFEGEIQRQLKSFRYVVRTHTTGAWFWKRTYTTRTWEQVGRTIQENFNLSTTFNQKASEKRLTITTAAFGLGKDKKATIISYDIETFKAAIKDAFMSMMDPNTGKVISVEVVPWVENSQFQNLAGLDTAKVIRFDNKEVSVPLYEQKANLLTNAEFLQELSRTHRALLNIYYKAKLCKSYMEQNWALRDKNGRVAFDKDFPRWNQAGLGNRQLMNNRTGLRSTTTVNALYLMVKNPNPLRQKANDFMFSGISSVKSCTDKMMSVNLYGRPYFDFAQQCRALESKLGNLINETLDDHCMPSLM